MAQPTSLPGRVGNLSPEQQKALDALRAQLGPAAKEAGLDATAVRVPHVYAVHGWPLPV